MKNLNVSKVSALFMLLSTITASLIDHYTNIYTLIYLVTGVLLSLYIGYSKTQEKHKDSRDIKYAIVIFVLIGIPLLLFGDINKREFSYIAVSIMCNINTLLLLGVYRKEYGNESIEAFRKVVYRIITIK